MEYKILGDIHFDACTASHKLGLEFEEYKAKGVLYEVRDKGNGELFWYSVMGYHESIEHVLNNPEMTVSRIDVALDVDLNWYDVDKIFANEGKDFPVKFMRHTKYISSSGRTIYFGSGDKLLRIYEKGKQLNHPVFPNWVRFEFQLKGRYARQALEATKDPEELFGALQEKYLYNIFPCKSAERLGFSAPEKDSMKYWSKVVVPFLKNNFSSIQLLGLLRPIIEEMQAKEMKKTYKGLEQ